MPQTLGSCGEARREGGIKSVGEEGQGVGEGEGEVAEWCGVAWRVSHGDGLKGSGAM